MLDRNRQHALSSPSGQQLADFHNDRTQYYGGYGLEPEEDTRGLDPLKLLFYVVQYRWLIVISLAAGLVSGVILTFMQTPKYQATATLEVLVPSAKVFQDMEVVSEASDVRAFLTAREKLLSRALAQRVVFQLGLTEKADFLFPKPDFSVSNIVYRAFGIRGQPLLEDISPEQREQIAIGRVRGDLAVQLVPNTSLLSITFRDQRPEYARDVANQLAQSFIDSRIDQTGETSDLARQFIQEQVAQTKQKLQASEEELVAYAKQVGLSVNEADKPLITSNIVDINKALTEAIQERLDVGRLVQQIDAGRGESLEQVLGSKPLQDLQAKVAELEGEYQQKLSMFKPGFPEMQQLSARIRELKKQINAGAMTILGSIRLQHQEKIEKEANLRAKLTELEAQQLEYNDKNIKYTILKREVDSNRSQYESLIAKLNDIGVSSELKTRTASIIDPATLPGAPFSPRKLFNIAGALALFAALCVVIIYILELLNNSFTNPEQVEKELGTSVLGILPMVDDKQLAESLSDQKSGLSEAHRSLRTALQFSGADGAPKILLVTSAEAAEGKSTTAFKLGRDFATLGTQVLIIDGDLRRPNVHRLFGLSNTIGLSNLLTSTVRREDVPNLFRKTKYPNVTVLTSGTIPPNPADLLASHRMAQALASLAKRFDMIIIDAPPVVGLSDAPILGRLADGVLMVVSNNQVTRKSAKAAVRRLRSSGANIVGVVVSKFSVSKFDYNYAYKYMNYQYYTYGAETPKLGASSDATPERAAKGRPSLMARASAGFRSRLDSFLARARSSS
ncbi:GumC family protein [Oryzicola mucosus]|uniref:non-specific protein-tyrosine kinase n=1 Tax=Oryzicola mucosus TaxID=2767425 RepID=A0A8J6PEL2_9HYPH|nr:polysaccharide biosynthesis tyrosine autokinase [Oryzicola mucosus]MBD0413464.1 polysaccharide biosynthesis tyrosine autokinase [Oryzicola mucosus]